MHFDLTPSVTNKLKTKAAAASTLPVIMKEGRGSIQELQDGLNHHRQMMDPVNQQPVIDLYFNYKHLEWRVKTLDQTSNLFQTLDWTINQVTPQTRLNPIIYLLLLTVSSSPLYTSP